MKHTLYEYRYVSDELHATYFQGKYDSITKISKIISFAQLAFCYPVEFIFTKQSLLRTNTTHHLKPEAYFTDRD